MKVTLEKEYRHYYTLEDLDRAKAVIQAEKEDEETVVGWAEYAMREAGMYSGEIVKATAHTAKNCRAWNAYGTETPSANMDIWIEFTAFGWFDGVTNTNSIGFIKAGAYLTDIWGTGATPYKHHMYIEKYTRAGN